MKQLVVLLACISVFLCGCVEQGLPVCEVNQACHDPITITFTGAVVMCEEEVDARELVPTCIDERVSVIITEPVSFCVGRALSFEQLEESCNRIDPGSYIIDIRNFVEVPP